MKRSDLFFSAFLVPTDYIMLILSGVFVYFLRFTAFTSLRPVIYEIPFKQYFISVLSIALLWLGIFALAGLYNLGLKRRFSREVPKVFLACSMGIMLVVAFIFFEREYFSSRFIVLAAWVVSIIFVSVGRALVHIFELLLYKKGKNLEPVLILGQDETTKRIIDYLKNNPGAGYQILGNPKSFSSLQEKWSGRTAEVYQVIQTDSFLERSEVLKIIEFCQEHQIIFRYAADIFDFLASNVQMEEINGVPIITLGQTALCGWGKIAKRFIDLIGAFLILVFLAPLFLLLGIIIKIDSHGPVFVSLKRIGQKNRPFQLYKFRSMVPNAQKLKKELLKHNERKGPLFKMKNDPRITRFGRFLRKTSLDELPQLFNIIRGEMSLVGPRPHEPEEVVNYARHYKRLLAIKPGLTGLSQISGRSKLSFREEAKLDIYYIENWSLLFDLQIMLMTIPVILTAKNAS
ncbi:hypothetical protein B6D52_01220 [Candidatus Parcubacteria bacterium 4484_255]|nr:MAG: hypothetical protein B6D52_01220 [Candidatus Parcubacteria bacterium 4484_255]